MRLLLRASLLVGLLGGFGLSARADNRDTSPADAVAIPVRDLLVLPPAGRAVRTPIPTNPVEARRVRGDLVPPQEGEGGWRRIAADEAGAFKDPALQGGSAFAVVESPTERVMLLEASGHGSVVVNGEPRAGDPYGYGFLRLPVLLKAGRNELLFRAGRGTLKARIVPPPAEVFLSTADATVPDVIAGKGGTYDLGVVVTNATPSWREGLAIVASVGGGPPRETAVPPLPPLSVFKAPIQVDAPAVAGGESVEVALDLRTGSEPPARVVLPLKVVSPGATHKRTFVSGIDGSVQYYAVVPAKPEPGDEKPPALILTLHGASVEATGQAAAYAAKSWATIVAPTNRRPFGFDWEDWGRLDALEVLRQADRLFRMESVRNGDPWRRVYLTGHSMGGHGTWILGAQTPGLFAAIAPSAGWRDFASYAGAAEIDSKDPVGAVLDRCQNASRTLLLEDNYRHVGVYVLHGDADDNVQVEQARFMRERLARFHPDFAYYERPGAGHWWGNECVDWPPLLEFLRRHETAERRDVSFTSVHPSITARCGFVGIDAQRTSMAPSRIEVVYSASDSRYTLRTENVAAGSLSLEDEYPERATTRLTVDGQDLGPPQTGRSHRFRWTGTQWRRGGVESIRRDGPSVKEPDRCGPFKEAFRNGVAFVVGTRGTPEENAWALAKARYDAEVFYYRGNGAIRVVTDERLDSLEPDQSVVLYGHRGMNSAWDRVLDSSPVVVERSAVTVGDRRIEGDGLGVLLVRPRMDGAGSVGVVAGTGPAGMRAVETLPYFVSGCHYPDWTVVSADVWEKGLPGVKGCGFFDVGWALGSDYAIRE